MPATSYHEYDQHNVREYLMRLGVGSFNATMLVQDVFVAPATSDPKQPPVILMVRKIQQRLGVPTTGYLDVDTANALQAVAGPGWMSLPWIDLIKIVLARTDGKPPPYFAKAIRKTRPTPPDPHLEHSLEGPLDFLPDVPGGIVTYAVAGFLLYRYLKKR